MPPHMESETENHPFPPQLAPYLEVEGIKDEGFSPHMHVGGMWGTLDVGVIAHSPAQVVHGQHRSLVHALRPQVLVVCGHRGGGMCRHGSPKHGHLRHNQAGINTHTGKHSSSTARSIPIPAPLWQTPRRAQHLSDPACTCRDGVEAQGEGWRVPELHRHIDVGQRGTQDDGRQDLGIAPAGDKQGWAVTGSCVPWSLAGCRLRGMFSLQGLPDHLLTSLPHPTGGAQVRC